MGLIHFYNGSVTANATNGTLVSEGDGSNPISLLSSGTPTTVAARCDSGKQMVNPTFQPTDTHIAVSVDNGVTYGAYGAGVQYNGTIQDKNVLILLMAQALGGDSGSISSVDIQILGNTPTDIPTLSAPSITATSPVYDTIRITITTPATSNVGANVVYDYYVDGVLKESGLTATTKDYTVTAGTHSTYVIARDAVNNLQQQSNTVSGVTVSDPPANQAPVASNVSISGTATVGNLLTGNYTYSDVDGNPEGVSTFRWLRNGVVISGATAKTYTVVIADQGTTLTFEVTPIATTGVLSGTPATAQVSIPANVAPSFTVQPSASSITQTSATISYSATDDVGISTHEVSTNNGSTYTSISPSGTAPNFTYPLTGLTQGTSYQVLIRVGDVSGLKTVSNVLNLNTIANQAPTFTAQPTISNITTTGARISYSATDDIAVTTHEISFDNGSTWANITAQGTAPNFYYDATTLQASTSYNCKVRVGDVLGLKTISNTVPFTTSAINGAPTFSMNPRLKANSVIYSAGQYSWIIEFGLNTQSPGVLTDNEGDAITVSKCLAYTGSTPNETSYIAATPTYNSGTGLWEITDSYTYGGSYNYWVRLTDATHTAAGGTHANIEIVLNATPSVPTGLSATNKTKTGFRLNWNTSNDQEGNNPITYDVFKGGELYQSGISNIYLDITGQGVNSTATWTVSAVDSLGNESAQSTGLPVTTLADILPTISSVNVSVTDTTHLTISGTYSDDESATGIDWFIDTSSSLSGDLSSNYTAATNKGSMSGADINTGASTFTKAVTLGTALVSSTNYYIYARAIDVSGTGTAWTRSTVFAVGHTSDFAGTSGTVPDTNLFTTTKAGTGVAQLDGSGRLTVSTPSTSLSDVALVVVKNNVTKITKTRKTKVKLTTAMASGGIIDILSTIQTASSPVADTAANNNTKLQIRIMFRDTSGTNTIDIIYFDTTNTQQRWDFTTHTWMPSGNTRYTVVLNTDYVVQIETTTTQWRIVIKSADESTIIDTTSWVNWSATRDTGNPMWAFMGDPTNDNASGSMSYDWYDEF